jgi:hypothetical protein
MIRRTSARRPAARRPSAPRPATRLGSVRWRHVAAAVVLITTGAACASTPRGEAGGVSNATRYDARASQTRATGTAGRDRGAATRRRW